MQNSKKFYELYMNAERKLVLEYIFKFIQKLLSDMKHPVLDDNWVIVQTFPQEIFLYSAKKQLLMQVKYGPTALSEKPIYQINIISSKDIDYNNKVITFDINNFEQFEIRQFWFNASMPQITISDEKILIPEVNAINIFLEAFRLNRYFPILTRATKFEKDKLAPHVNLLKNKLNHMLQCASKSSSLSIGDNRIVIKRDMFEVLLEKSDDVWDGYCFGYNHIYDSLKSSENVVLLPNLSLCDAEIITYDVNFMNFFNSINKAYEEIVPNNSEKNEEIKNKVKM